MLFTLVVGFIGLLCLWEYLHKKHRNDVLRKSKIKGTFSLPLIGGAYIFRGRTLENTVEIVRKAVLDRGKISYTWLFSELNIFYAIPKDLEVILSSQTLVAKNNVYDLLGSWLGNGLLMSTGKKWHTRRKIITPSFHFKILEQFVEVFESQSDILVKKLTAKADGKSIVDMFPLICLTALDIIGETSMGVKINAQMNPNLAYTQAVKEVTNLIAMRMRTPLWRYDWTFRLTEPKEFHKMKKNIQLMQDFTNDVIRKRRATLTESLTESRPTNNADEDDDIGSKKRMALLDVLLQARVDGQPLTDEDIREEVETFMFEGHDTTTSGISFALYLISRHPDTQEKLMREIRSIIGDDPAKRVTIKELQELKYMECVLKESMRLYPPVPIIGRYFPEDVEINDKVIPGKTHVNIPLFIVLRDPDNFDDPDDFKPERFVNEEDVKRYPFSYTPFSAGPRNCIGQKYAMLEMKSTISKILRYFELLPLGEDVVPSLSLILRSATGMNMGFKTREYK